MRWIDRGPEPPTLQEYAHHFTKDWVEYYLNRTGHEPDPHWSDFRDTLARCSGNVCWYCERLCRTDTDDNQKSCTIDHFRPRWRFPELTYEWGNWIFSCRRCNVEYKQGKWPESGYVDPSAPDEEERPEQYFDYDSATGDIIPKPGLQGPARARALQTIEDLGLNALDVRYYRLDWTRRFISDWEMLQASDQSAFVQYWTQLGFEFAGATLMAIRALEP